MESFEDRLRQDLQYQTLMTECWNEWRKCRAKPVWEHTEWERLCGLRETRYMAIKREWEAEQ